MEATRTKLKKNTSDKYELKFEDEFTIDIWKYDRRINRFGPVEVSITYKSELKIKKPAK